MRIRSKTLLVAGVGGLLLAGAWWIVVESVISPRFLALEQREARNHLARLDQVLEQQTSALLDKSGDWALWDDAFRFVQDGNQAFRDANLIATTSQSMRLNQVAYLGFDGRLVGGGSCDLATGKALEDPPLAHIDTSPEGPILGPARQGRKSAGFLSTSQGPVLIAFQPVRQSDGGGSPQGAVVFIRRVDDDKLREWSELLQLPVRWDPPGQETPIRLTGPNSLEVHRNIHDLLGKPLACVSLTAGRDIALVGQQSVRDLLLGGMAVVALLTALLATALEWLVLQRLSRLAREVGTIDQGGAITVDGQDEVTALAGSIVSAVERAANAAASATLEQRRFTALFQRSGDGILIIERGHVVEANRAAFGLFGDGLLGQAYERLLPGASGTRAAIRSHSSPTSPAREVLIATLTGMRIPAEVREALVDVDGHDYLAVIIRDLREQKAAERELQLLASVMDSTSDLLLVLTADGAPHTANAALRRHLLVPGDEPWAAGIFAPEVRVAMVDALGGAVQQPWRGETTLSTTEPLPVSALAFPILDGSGSPSHVALVMRDIRQERERESALNRARLEAERAAQAKSSFLAVMSHELRTPLNGVIGMASLLARTPMSAVQTDYVRTISDCAEGLLRQINDVLDLTRLESDGVVLESAPVDLRRVAEEAIAICAPRATEKSLELGFIAGLLPERLGDGARIRQILINLLGNAVKFTDQGGVSISASSDAQGALVLEVQDTGIGMDPDVLPRLFTPFVQADSTMTRRYGGTGLGLAISQRLAQRMGGGITVTSQPGIGSTFTLRLPLPVTGPARKPADLSAMKALVVDHRPVARISITSLLEACGATVRSSSEPADPLPGECLIAPLDATDTRDLVMRHGGIATMPLGASLALPGNAIVLNRPIRLATLLEAIQRRPVAAAPTTWADQEPSTPRILVVEDNPTNRLMVRSMLELLGSSCVEAVHGQEALELLGRQQFDLVLMDGQMPIMDGFEAVRRWRALEALEGRPRTTIVALTALALPGDDVRCRAAGMDDYLTKPFTVDRLDQLLKTWLPR